MRSIAVPKVGESKNLELSPKLDSVNSYAPINEGKRFLVGWQQNSPSILLGSKMSSVAFNLILDLVNIVTILDHGASNTVYY